MSDKVWAVRSGEHTLSYHHTLRRAQDACAGGQEVIKVEGDKEIPFWRPPEQRAPRAPMHLMLHVK